MVSGKEVIEAFGITRNELSAMVRYGGIQRKHREPWTFSQVMELQLVYLRTHNDLPETAINLIKDMADAEVNDRLEEEKNGND